MKISKEEERTMVEAIWQAERDGDERGHVFRAGILAGLERAAKEFERRKALADEGRHDDSFDEGGDWIASVIRKLATP